MIDPGILPTETMNPLTPVPKTASMIDVFYRAWGTPGLIAYFRPQCRDHHCPDLGQA